RPEATCSFINVLIRFSRSAESPARCGAADGRSAPTASANAKPNKEVSRWGYDTSKENLMKRLFLALAALPIFGADCDNLTALKLKDATITAAQVVAAGAFAPPSGSGAAFKDLPAFCRVQGVIKPSSDSNIEFEVWMPATGWNGKYYGVGNGGFAGSIQYIPLAAAIRNGYAASSTDTGHKANATDGEWALNHYEKI